MKAEHYKALGLIRWKQRDTDPIEETSVEPIEERSQAGLMIVGDGELFDGAEGQLLTAMLNAINLKRDDVLIVNVAVFARQLEMVKPAMMLAMGETAAHDLLRKKIPIDELRLKKHEYGTDKIPFVITYHPADLLRRPADKKKAWQDLQFLQQIFVGSEN